MEQKPIEINLSLTIDEVNGVIATLAQLPFNQVHDLVNKIRNQAIVQVQALAQQEQQAQPEATEGSAEGAND